MSDEEIAETEGTALHEPSNVPTTQANPNINTPPRERNIAEIREETAAERREREAQAREARARRPKKTNLVVGTDSEEEAEEGLRTIAKPARRMANVKDMVPDTDTEYNYASLDTNAITIESGADKLTPLKKKVSISQQAVARTLRVTATAKFNALSDILRKAIDGILAHELNVGDAKYIKVENRLVMPFDPMFQYMYTLLASGDSKKAKVLTYARMGLLGFWGDFLGRADAEESMPAEDLHGAMVSVVEEMKTGNKNTTKAFTLYEGDRDREVKIPERALTEADADWEADAHYAEVLVPSSGQRADITGKMIYLHMKDIGMLVSVSLIKSGHHYLTEQNGSFRAIEKKRFGEASIPEDIRGILYHEAMHPFTRAAKLAIYNAWKNSKNRSKSPWAELDPVIMKRLPVVPAGAAWLAAGLSIMDEMLGIPMIAAKIPEEYKLSLVPARKALEAVKDNGYVIPGSINQYEAIAAFAFGLLNVISPQHSALNAPSFAKMHEQHIGAAMAGDALARNIQRNM